MISRAKLQFLAYQKPALESGTYQVEMTQSVQANGDSASESFTQSLDFVVLGERFSLPPEAIHAKFPPAGSFGRHSDCIPHLSIKQSTFCWQRSAYNEDDFEPWVALLLFDQSELDSEQVKASTITLGELQRSVPLELEVSQQASDKVNVIDVDPDLLAKVIPSGDELKTLAHVRKTKDDESDASEQELAVVIGNRLPKAGSSSVVHLVSVEGRYNSQKQFARPSGHSGPVRLVSLANWGFSCPAEDGDNFESLVENLHTGLMIPSPAPANTAAADHASPQDNPVAQKVAQLKQQGYQPFAHHLRQTDQTLSWYRGPLAPCAVAPEFTQHTPLPEFGDRLTRCFDELAMLDVSYSAAYELGRALALEDEIFCDDLYRWKKQYNQAVCAQLQQSDIQGLTPQTNAVAPLSVAPALREKISQWLHKLALLEDVPFNYLLPHASALPAHSLKCFVLDEHWRESLLWGALSIGGVIRQASLQDEGRWSVFERFTRDIFAAPVTGFLLHSELVSDYPDIQISAYSAQINSSAALSVQQRETSLPLLRRQQLGPQVMLCLFRGEIATLELYLKPEGLHYGLDEELEHGVWKRKKELSTAYLYNAVKNHLPADTPIRKPLAEIQSQIASKQLFYQAGSDDPAADGGRFEFPVQFKEQAQALRILDIQQLTQSLGQRLTGMASEMTGLNAGQLPQVITQPSSAQFGMHMLEGSNKGRFVKSTQGSQQ